MPEGPVLIAASGGPDSTALATIGAIRGDATLGHVDHRLVRESAGFVEHVRSLGERLSMPVLVATLDPDAIHDGPLGLEAEARTLRYRALASMAPHPILTAHTAHDRLDTVLMRLVQGTGVDALDGPRTSTQIAGRLVVRPMLEWFEEDVAELLRTLGLEPVRDPGNSDLDRLRNRIRPVARALCEVADRAALARSLDTIATDAARLRARDELLLDRLSRTVGDELLLSGPMYALLNATERATVAHRALRRLRVRAGRRFCEQVAGADRGDRLRAHGVVVEHAGHVVRLSCADGDVLNPIEVDAPVPLVPGQISTPLGELVLSDSVDTAQVWLDPTGIEGDLRIRTLRRGDRFVPAGRSNEVSIVERLKRDSVPAAVRRATLVVADDVGPLWVVSGRRSQRTTIAPGDDVIAIRWQPWGE